MHRQFEVQLATWAVLLVAAPPGVSTAQVPPVRGYSIAQIGLTGSGYEYAATGGGIVRTGAADHLTRGGQVLGHSQRCNPSATNLGQDAWLFNGSTTQLIGLAGSGYEYTSTGTGGGTYRAAFPLQFNEAGVAIGYSERRNASGFSLAYDGWFFNGSATQLIGLTGTGYQYTYTGTGGGIVRYGIASQLNAAGQISGYSYRYTASGNDLGRDTWLYNGTTTQLIGLTGNGYEYTSAGAGGGTFRFIRADRLNEAGQLIGTSDRYGPGGSGLGIDAWLYNGTTTELIGLTGSPYQYTTQSGQLFRGGTCQELNAVGKVLGYSQRYTAQGGDLGVDCWLYNGTTTQYIGLTGSGYEYTFTGAGGGIYRYGHAEQLNATGQVAGLSLRRNASGGSIGGDAWLFNGASTQSIGLTGSGYEYTYAGNGGGTFRGSMAEHLNDAGQVTGSSQRYTAGGNQLGRDAWLYNGSTTELIGLTGVGYEYPLFTGIYRASTAVQLNAAGQAVGYSERRSPSGLSLGQSGWFYDDDTSTTSELAFSVRSTDQYSFTNPQFLTETGAVLGEYRLFSGASDMGTRAFWWSIDDGFHDLGGLVNGGLTAAGWQYLSSGYTSSVPGAMGEFPGGSPLYILGNGQVIGQSGGQSVYLLTGVVPEASGLTTSALISLILRRRRRS